MKTLRASTRHGAVALAVVLSVTFLACCGSAHATAVAGRSAAGAPGSGASALGSTPALAASIKANSIYWGAYVGTDYTRQSVPWDMAGWTDFRARDAGGKGMSIDPFYLAFNDCDSGVEDCSPYPFPSTQLSNIRNQGAIPMISWGSYTLADSTKNVNGTAAVDPKFTLKDLAAGDYDSYIRSFAESAKAWRHPFFLRFDWEMNGNWYPWGLKVGSNTPAEFVQAWRRVYDIFQTVGASNANFVWCPNGGDDLSQLKALYPGNQYVSWTCADIYNFGLSDQGSGWETFDQALTPTYDVITQQIAPNKPFMIGEFGSVQAGGSQSQWMSTALADTPTQFPKVKAMVLFDYDPSDVGLTLNTPASTRAFSAGIRRPAYAGARFGKISTIAVP